MSLVKSLIFISGALELAPFTQQSQPVTLEEKDTENFYNFSSTCLVSYNMKMVVLLLTAAVVTLFLMCECKNSFGLQKVQMNLYQIAYDA